MALFNILVVFAVLCVLTLWKRLTRKDKIPPGLKKLPGPKGTLVLNLTRRVCLCPRCKDSGIPLPVEDFELFGWIVKLPSSIILSVLSSLI
jgi:hypothetical protein